MFPFRRGAGSKDPDLDENERIVAVHAPDVDDRVTLATNAPPEWPTVSVAPGTPAESPAQFNARVSLEIAAALKGAGIRVTEFSREVRLDGRPLVVDLVVAHEGREVPVFVLPGDDPAAEGESVRFVQDALAAAGLFTGATVRWYAPRAPVTA